MRMTLLAPTTASKNRCTPILCSGRRMRWSRWRALAGQGKAIGLRETSPDAALCLLMAASLLRPLTMYRISDAGTPCDRRLRPSDATLDGGGDDNRYCRLRLRELD